MNTFVQLDEAGQTAGAFEQKGGKLDGVGVSYYPNQRPMLAASYSKMDRDGPLRVWGEDGKLVVFAEYKKGRMHGLVCLFKQGVPWLIQEYATGVLKGQYLVTLAAGVATVVLPDTPGSVVDPQLLSAAEASLAAIIEQIDQQEAQVRREFLEWYREEDKLRKQNMVSARAPGKRIARQQKNAAKAAEANARIRNQMGDAMRRSGL